MFTKIKDHPFAVEAFFETSLVLTYAINKKALENLIPPCLALDTFEDKWAFVAVAVVKTKDLRPKGFPKTFGNDFTLIGYRIFVKYTTNAGKKLRGLYILKSETDNKKMQLFGNIFTHYNYTTTDIGLERKNEELSVQSSKSAIDIRVEFSSNDVALPQNSPFKNWKEARRFAGPLPFTFTYDQSRNSVLIIEGVRTNWAPTPVKVLHHDVGFLKTIACQEILLANAFVINNIPYYWKKGKIEKWKQ